jgi:hypothetical protein
MSMSLYCAMPPSSNAINALLTDTTYLHKWSGSIEEDNKNYYSILSNNSTNNSTTTSGNLNCQQSRTFSGFHTSVNFQH